jgi:hypothetical protein
MPLVYRPARADELQRAQELVVRSINDLTGRAARAIRLSGWRQET